MFAIVMLLSMAAPPACPAGLCWRYQCAEPGCGDDYAYRICVEGGDPLASYTFLVEQSDTPDLQSVTVLTDEYGDGCTEFCQQDWLLYKAWPPCGYVPRVQCCQPPNLCQRLQDLLHCE